MQPVGVSLLGTIVDKVVKYDGCAYSMPVLLSLFIFDNLIAKSLMASMLKFLGPNSSLQNRLVR